MEECIGHPKKEYFMHQIQFLRKPINKISDSFWHDLFGPGGIRELFKGFRNVDYEEVISFKNIMNALQVAIESEISNHFALIKVEDFVQTNLSEIPKAQPLNPHEALDASITLGNIRANINKSIFSDNKIQGEKVLHLGKSRMSCTIYSIYYVEPKSKFAQLLLTTEPQEEILNTFLSIFFPTWSSLIQIVRSIILNFYFFF